MIHFDSNLFFLFFLSFSTFFFFFKGFLSHCRERRAREIRGAPPDGTIQVHHGVNDDLSQLDIRQVRVLCVLFVVSKIFYIHVHSYIYIYIFNFFSFS